MEAVGIVGLGHYLPSNIRTNDDPVFTDIRASGKYKEFTERDLFQGFQERRYVDSSQSAEDLMVKAGELALADAGIKANKIDRIYGCASPSRNISPNGLFELHHRLECRRDAQVVPIHTEFTNFITGLQLAQEAILAGKIRYAMVNCGSAWTRNVDFAYPHALGIADGAGAVIVGPNSKFVILDSICETHSEYFDGMTLAHRNDDNRTTPIFAINDKGVEVFVEKGMSIPIQLCEKIFQRNNIDPSEVALITHQASSNLTEYWKEKICPKIYIETVTKYGNVTLATVPINFSEFSKDISTPYVLLLQLGLGPHFSAMLLKQVQ